MKALNVLIALVICIQANVSFASPVSNEEIQYNFSKLRYQVENGNFATSEELKKATTDVAADLMAGGASTDQIFDFIVANIKDLNKKADFYALVRVMKLQKLSEKEMLNRASNFFTELGQHGAEYRSSILIVHVSWPIVLIVLTIFILTAPNPPRTTCRNCY